jgi:heme/copper-type cytochrome/quinol oxidase subunit 2
MTRHLVAGALLLAGWAHAAPAPDQTVAVVISRDGIEPREIAVRKGETVRLVVKSADGEHCFALDDLRIEKRVLPGKTTTVDVTPDKPGTFPFYCCLETGAAADKQRGRLIVTE